MFDWLFGGNTSKKDTKLLDDIKEKLNENKKEEEKVEEPKEPEKPKEMIDVSAEGFVRFEVVNREERYHWESPVYIVFNYHATVKFLDEEIKSSGIFYLNNVEEYKRGDTRLMSRSNAETLEERAYKILIEMIEEGDSYIMDNVKNKIIYDIEKHIRDNRVEKLKKQIGDSQKLDFNFTFQIEKKDN